MMDFSLFKRSGLKLLPVLLTLTASPSLLKAVNLLTPVPAAPTLTCSTATGTTPVTVTLTPGSSSGSLTTVTFAALSGGVTVTPASATIASGTKNPVIFSVSLAPGCVGVTNAGTPTVQFKVNGTNDATITVTSNVAAGTTNPLTASPNPVSVTCVYNPANGGSFTPGPAVTVSATSAATGGTPVTATAVSSWLSVGAVSGSPATTTAATFTVQAQSPCSGPGNITTGTVPGSITLGAGGIAATKSLTVNTVIVPPTPLSISPALPSFTYVKSSGAAGYVDVNVTSTVPTNTYFFAVNTATMPSWLTVSSLNGTTPKSIRFSSTNVADTLAPGTYSASVHITVSSTGDLTIPITMLLTNSAPKLSATVSTPGTPSPGTNINWQIGQPLPTPTITAFSTDTPIPFTVSVAGPLGPSVPVSQLSGLAYSFGTPINVSFSSQVFAAAVPNQVLTGTVTLTYGNPAATIVETFNVTVQSPSATLTALSPATIPTSNASPVTTFRVTLTGSGFITGTDPTRRTTVGIVAQGASNNALTLDSAFAVDVQNSSNIILTITVPSATDTLLPFAVSGTGGPVTIGVCNPINGAACTMATGMQTLTIGSGPIIQAVTSSSSLTQVTAPTLPSVAPYDMISIFGTSFCSQSGTGCTTNQVLYGTPDSTLQTYPTTLTPPGQSGTPLSLSVTFYQHGTTTSLGTAPLLFATNNQINALVPSGVSSKIGNMIDLVVTYGTKSSTAFVLNCVATDPGLFTIGADGQGISAALDANYNLIGQSNPAGMRHTATSDSVSIYMTGLGVPETGADDTTTGGGAYPADCASVASYLTQLTSVTGNTLTTLDGAIINPTVINTGRFVPCVGGAGSFAPTVTIGSVTGNVTYAGWVAGTIAGLYQMNVTLPLSAGGPFTDINGNSVTEAGLAKAVALPVTVTSNSVASQTGVSLWVQRRLAISAPGTVSGNVGQPWVTTGGANLTTASDGTGPYSYTITKGLLPPGLTLNPTTSAITGTPNAGAAGTYQITVTATDSSLPTPLTGSVTFTLTIGGGVYLTHGTPGTVTNGTANASVLTETPTTGLAPYTWTITAADTTAIAGLSITSGGVVQAASTLLAGTYNVLATATDATTPTALVGKDYWSLTSGLGITKGAVTAPTAGSASTITQLTITGLTGPLSAVTYTFDATTTALGCLSVDSSGNFKASAGCASHASYTATIYATDSAQPANASAPGTGSIQVTFAIN